MMVALASNGVRLMPSMPEHDGARHDEDEEAPDVGHDARHGGDPGSGPRASPSGWPPGWPRGRGRGGSPGAQPGDDQGDEDDDQDAERPHDQVRDRRRRVRADARAWSGGGRASPRPGRPDRLLLDRPAGCPPGQGAAPGRVRSRPVFCPRIRLMTTLARTHVAARRSVPPFDLILVVATLLVSVIGVVMVYTATRGSLLAEGDDPKTFLKKQGLFVVLGVITMVVVALIDYRRLEPIANILYWLIVLALLGVFVVGSSAQGAARWFSLGPAAAAALRVRRPGADPGRGVVLRAPRRRGPGLARRLPAADHGRHPDRPGAAPARPRDGDDHGDRPARPAGRRRPARSGSSSCCSSGTALVASWPSRAACCTTTRSPG